MITERGIVLPVVLLSTVVLAAGCSSPAAGPSPSPSPAPSVSIPADPAQALAAAQARLGTESAHFAQDTGGAVADYTGTVDARTGNWQVNGTEYAVRRVGTELYLQASGKRLENLLVTDAAREKLTAGGWVHTRVPTWSASSLMFNDKFPWNLANPALQAKAVNRTGTRTYTGTRTIVTSPNTSHQGSRPVKVTAGLDEQGRFSRIDLYLDPKKPARPMIVRFTDFGTPVEITAPPPADVVETDDPTILSAMGLP